jgi:hypothetical protein
MEPFRALFDLLRFGARIHEAKQRAGRAIHSAVNVTLLLSMAITVAGLGLCVLAYALDRVLAHWLGEIGSALVLALLLLAGALALLQRAQTMMKMPAPPPAPPPSNEEMSTAALLALVGGIVVGTLLQARKDQS